MNRLARERSPYLLQHAANPVDWHPWGEEAFARARGEDKPIFLSIGYSTCHWCHVMEHESFENQEIARLLNADFVSIKVDREERPDVDRVYMSFVQSTTGSGGWPMTVFLTPDLKPFYGGTYFPPASKLGTSGLSRRARRARARVEERTPACRTGGRRAARPLEDGHWQRTAGRRRSRRSPARGARRRRRSATDVFDQRRGGFGDAPKFPRPSELLFLLREHARREARGGSGEVPLQDGQRTRCARWRSAACAITSAAASTATRSTPIGACRISRRCSTTRRSSCSRISKRRRQPATTSTVPSPRTRSPT